MKTGRSTDYRGAEAPPKRYALRAYNSTTEAIEQFERMARGYSPVAVRGDTVAWVADDTLTPELRAWCSETAHQIRREAELACVKRPKPPAGIGARRLNRTKADIEAMVSRVLARYPDATANQVVVITGLQRRQVLEAEAWILAHLGKGGERG